MADLALSQPPSFEASIPTESSTFPSERLKTGSAHEDVGVLSGSGTASPTFSKTLSSSIPPKPQPTLRPAVSTDEVSSLSSSFRTHLTALLLKQLRGRLYATKAELDAVTAQRDALESKAASAVETLQQSLSDSVVRSQEAGTLAAERDALRAGTDALRVEADALRAAMGEAQAAHAREEEAASELRARANEQLLKLEAARNELAKLRTELEEARRGGNERNNLLAAVQANVQLRSRHCGAKGHVAASEEDHDHAEQQARQVHGALEEELVGSNHPIYSWQRDPGSGPDDEENGEELERAVHPRIDPALHINYEELLEELARERQLRVEVEAREADGLQRREDAERRAREAEKERQVLEAALDDVKRECIEPFIVPALVDAIKDLARMQAASETCARDGDMDNVFIEPTNVDCGA